METSPSTNDAPPKALLIATGAALAGITALAFWQWLERGPAILLDMGRVLCF